MTCSLPKGVPQIQQRLESFGHEVVHAIDGLTAIEHFQKDSYDLILMDIEMPGMNGFETTTRIRALEGHEAWAWTPIIFVTATDTDTNLITAIEAGGDAPLGGVGALCAE